MIHPILTYPDARLKQKSTPVEHFDADLHQLLDDMYDTMMEYGGIGLAAIQIGIPKEILIINLADDDGNQHKEELLEVINPIITATESTQKYTEGCLSLPNYYEDVIRAEKIIVTYSDRHGLTRTLEAHGLLSVAFQHEMDHLKGTLFFERLSITKRKKFDKEYPAIASKSPQRPRRDNRSVSDTRGA